MEKQSDMKEQSDVIQLFTYEKLKGPRAVQKVNFKHSDGSLNEACLFATGGYYQLDLTRYIPDKEQKTPSKEDRVRDWMRVAKKGLQEGENKDCGWKFHISIAQEPENIQKAWDTLAPILLQYKVGSAKIPQPRLEPEANKVLTVYTFKGGPEIHQWGSFLRDVESAFRSQGVAKGGPIQENQITNSHYFYYRNDKGSDGKYKANVDMKADAEGPFKDIDMHELLSQNRSPLMHK